MSELLTRREMEEKLGRAFTPEQTASLVELLEVFWRIEIERAADTRALKQGLTALSEEVGKLAEAQRRTEERLAEFEQRTEERFAALAEAQQRTEESLAQLSTSINEMARGLDDLRLQVGSLANTFGFDFEEFVSALLPPYLERHFGITKVFLKREYFPLPDKRFEEVDLVSDCYWNGKPAVVLVECSVTIGGSRVRNIAEKFEKVAAHLKEWKGEVVKIVRIIVSMNVHPTAEEAAKETGIWIIPYHNIYWRIGPRAQMNAEGR